MSTFKIKSIILSKSLFLQDFKYLLKFIFKINSNLKPGVKDLQKIFFHTSNIPFLVFQMHSSTCLTFVTTWFFAQGQQKMHAWISIMNHRRKAAAV